MKDKQAKVFRIGPPPKEVEADEPEEIDYRALLDEVVSALESGADPTDIASSVREILDSAPEESEDEEDEDEGKAGIAPAMGLIDMNAFVKPGSL